MTVVGFAKNIVEDIVGAIHGDGKAIETLIADVDSIIGAVERLPIDCEDMVPKTYGLQGDFNMCIQSIADVGKSIVMLFVDYGLAIFDGDLLVNVINDFKEIFMAWMRGVHYCNPFSS
jgi:hypothetical protein